MDSVIRFPLSRAGDFKTDNGTSAPDHKTTMIQVKTKKGTKARKRVAADDHITVYAGCDGVATRQADVFFTDNEGLWTIMQDNERKLPKRDGKMLGIEMSRYP